jgi:hypothetical protein
MISGYSVVGEQLQHFYGILAGLYLFVRGMDNIRDGLPVPWRTTWDRIAHGHVGSEPNSSH